MARNFKRQEEEAEINITPMLDIVFIMLIFFIVTTAFVKEAGVEVVKPMADSSTARPRANIMIGVDEAGDIWMQGKKVEVPQIRGRVEAARAENPEGSVVIQADRNSDSGTVVKVIDQIKQAGVEGVAIAADESGGG